MFSIRYACLVLATILVALSAAAPAAHLARDVSLQVLQQLNLFAEYSAAAYCTGNLNSTGTKVTCPAGNCPQVQAANTTTLTEFLADGQYGELAGFLAADSTHKLIVLSFRGSRSPANWIANLDFAFDDAKDLCADCKVHGGFWKAWNTVADTLRTQIQKARAAYPDYKLVFTGHSLGAAIATVGTTDLRTREKYSIDMYSYGSPRVGNAELAEYITSLGSNYRVTHTDDIVPRLPPRAVGYRHPSPEYWITSGNDVAVTASDITVVEGVASSEGNAGEATPSTSAHGWYFGDIGKCQ
ncbi:Alpha/Beta hydrolase protein [Aspergillus ambiguus]|uniref:lipase family protein n=1 Tax=Aspergillus ambiguus TaxID=176160 RepID=UPI003CCC945E